MTSFFRSRIKLIFWLPSPVYRLWALLHFQQYKNLDFSKFQPRYVFKYKSNSSIAVQENQNVILVCNAEE